MLGLIAALIIVTCPGGQGCDGPNYVISDNTVLQGYELRVYGSVFVGTNAIGRDLNIICKGTAERDGVVFTGGNAMLINVNRTGPCGRGGNAGTRLSGTGNMLLEYTDRISEGDGLIVENAIGPVIAGVFVKATAGKSVQFLNSTNVYYFSSLTFDSVPASKIGVSFDPFTTGEIGMIRVYRNGGELHVPDKEQVGMTAAMCQAPLGEAVCLPGHYPEKPRYKIWTVCDPALHYYEGECDFLTPTVAFDSPLVIDFDVVVVHGGPGNLWPPFVIGKRLFVKGSTSGGSIGGGVPQGVGHGSYPHIPRAGDGVTAVVATQPVIVSGFDFLGAVDVPEGSLIVEVE